MVMVQVFDVLYHVLLRAALLPFYFRYRPKKTHNLPTKSNYNNAKSVAANLRVLVFRKLSLLLLNSVTRYGKYQLFTPRCR